jgi:DivIVA domain-containing protein
VELDRQAIERRDFPIGRRGYDTAAVDAHLRLLAAQVEELQRAAVTGASDVSLASTAGSHVQSILAAAETAAAEIERNALDEAREAREAADRDAQSTRSEAIEKASRHVAGVAQATAVLLERVGSMDGEVGALIESLRAGASRLATDLAALEENMGELYDAASGKTVTRAVAGEHSQPSIPAPPHPLSPPESAEPGVHLDPEAPASEPATGAAPVPPPAPGPAPTADPAVAGAGDVDGARLIALNMALNGESRADTERYLAENFALPDRLKLVDEVYAAIEG